MVPFRRLLDTLAGTSGKKWIWICLAAIPALRLYYVQEMIAALIMFSVLFVAVVTVVLVIFLLDRASQQIIAWAEAGAVRLGHWMAGTIEGIAERPVWANAVPHLFRREQPKEK